MDNEPRDVKNYVYIILLIHGIGTLLPWNMFITADQYFKEKVNVNNLSLITNGTREYHYEEKISEHLKDNFMYYITIASKLPNVITQGVNFMIQPKRQSLAIRIIWSIVIEAIIFALTMVFAIVDSSNWPNEFVAATLVSVVAINIANGVYQNCIYGVTALLPSKYTNSVVTGMNISGVITSIIMVISVASTPDYKMSAIFYFLTAVLFLIVCFGTYVLLTKNVSIMIHDNIESPDLMHDYLFRNSSFITQVDYHQVRVTRMKQSVHSMSHQKSQQLMACLEDQNGESTSS